jgi:hypothetical protein
VSDLDEGVPTVCLAVDCATCQSAGADLFAHELDGALVTVDFLPKKTGVVKVCVGGRHVASIDVVPTGCAFDAHALDTPCNAHACALDAHSEECQQYVAQYCATEVGSKDGGCGIAVPVFMRVAQTESHAQVHYAPTRGFTTAAFIPGVCFCETAAADTSCSDDQILIYETSFDAVSAILAVQFEPQLGEFRLCAYDKAGFRHHVFSVIGLATARADLGFAFPVGDVQAEEHPCAQAACKNPQSDECQIFTAQYCISHPVDAACQLLAPVFQRPSQSKVELVFPVPPESKFLIGSLSAVDAACGCGGCSGEVSALEVFSAVVEEDVLNIQVYANTPGSYVICNEDRSPVAFVDAYPAACVFDEEAAPCKSAACSGVASEEECMQVVADYCAARAIPDDGCDLFVPRFVRPVGVDAAIRSISRLGSR